MRDNAVRWGMCARHHVVAGEDKAEFDALHASLKDEWKPVTPRAIELVLNLTGAKWKQLRARRIEDELFSAAVDLHSSTCLGDAFREIGADLDRLRRYETTAVRAAEKAEAELARLAAERDAEHNADAVSFDAMLNNYLLAPLPNVGLRSRAREQAAINDESGSVSQNGPAEETVLPSPGLPPFGSVSQSAENEEETDSLDAPVPTPSCNFAKLDGDRSTAGEARCVFPGSVARLTDGRFPQAGVVFAPVAS